jgi:alpha-tubulin suppressor-like RCC1 family protein
MKVMPLTSSPNMIRYLFVMCFHLILFSFRNNAYGQLGCGDCGEATTMQKIETLSGIKAIACGANHSLAVDSKYSLF